MIPQVILGARLAIYIYICILHTSRYTLLLYTIYYIHLYIYRKPHLAGLNQRVDMQRQRDVERLRTSPHVVHGQEDHLVGLHARLQAAAH